MSPNTGGLILGEVRQGMTVEMGNETVIADGYLWRKVKPREVWDEWIAEGYVGSGAVIRTRYLQVVMGDVQLVLPNGVKRVVAVEGYVEWLVMGETWVAAYDPQIAGIIVST